MLNYPCRVKEDVKRWRVSLFSKVMEEVAHGRIQFKT